MPNSAPLQYRVRLLAAVVLGMACHGGTSPVTAPTCAPGAAFNGIECVAYARLSVERIATPWVESGRAITLEMVIYHPLGAGPYPTLIFHHGSTGSGNDPNLFRQTYTSDTLAKVLVGEGWQVIFPQRRGRGASDGVYDEGFEPDRSRYSCRQEYALQGLRHALDDADVIYQHVRLRSDVDASRLLVGGVSRGGILALAHAARHQGAYLGALNFVGGWLGEGCVDAVAVNRSTFIAAVTAPRVSIWLYGENDSFYSVAHSQANFNAFVAAGGNGDFNVYRRANASANGHFTCPNHRCGKATCSRT